MFDWTTVDAATMARRAHPDGGVWRQQDNGNPGALEVWLHEQAEWGFDSLRLAEDADQWLGQMEAGHLVLMRSGVFERARCGLENEPNHKHTRYCAGPTAGERRLQRSAARRVAR